MTFHVFFSHSFSFAKLNTLGFSNNSEVMMIHANYMLIKLLYVFVNVHMYIKK